mmetsp:Transcript_4266/g.8683  ORF Transcript_4266/g.8683 Transcript_4266/m.8683 type:complete len:206 (+) Transcript_4266:966-1583(+)
MPPASLRPVGKSDHRHTVTPPRPWGRSSSSGGRRGCRLRLRLSSLRCLCLRSRGLPPPRCGSVQFNKVTTNKHSPSFIDTVCHHLSCSGCVHVNRHLVGFNHTHNFICFNEVPYLFIPFLDGSLCDGFAHLGNLHDEQIARVRAKKTKLASKEFGFCPSLQGNHPMPRQHSSLTPQREKSAGQALHHQPPHALCSFTRTRPEDNC